MVRKFNPKIQRVLKTKTNLISTFSTETKLQILETAESGNVEVLKQKIEYTCLGGDY